VLEAFLRGLELVFEWPAIGYLMLGVLLGLWLGAVPGLGGIIGLVLLLPFTYNMEPVPAFALLLGMFAVTSTSDTIASVLLGVPGTAASQATVLDGHPLAQQGHAGRALGAAFTVSAFGGVFGAIVLALSLPLILPAIVAFQSPEFFMLSLLALVMVGSISGRSIFKGLAVAALGVLLATVGYAQAAAVPRYYLGSNYLLDGIPLVPIVLGLFALPEIMELALRNRSIARVSGDSVEGGDILDGVKDAFRHWWLAVRCSVIGTYVGILPGMGAAIVDWVAYSHAVQTAKDRSRFGKGDIRGVIAPEAANNATRGGSLLPAVAFGIPGSAGTAILMGALIIQGLRPGPEMLTNQLDLTFSMVWSIAIANVAVTLILLALSRQVAKISFVPGHLIVPGVILFVLMGAWLETANMGDWIALIVMGVVGYLMKRANWPRPPLVLAFILGPIMEDSFLITLRAYGDVAWMSRPLVIVMFVLIAGSVIYGALARYRRARKPGSGNDQLPDIEAGGGGPLLSFALGAVLLGTFVFAACQAEQWPDSVRRFPQFASLAGATIVLVCLYRDGLASKLELRQAGTAVEALRRMSRGALLPGAIKFFLLLIATFAVSAVLGQKIAIPLFIFGYLLFWGRYSPGVSMAYAASGWVVLVAFYDRLLHLVWYPAWLFYNLPGILPDWLPAWLFV